MIVIQCSCDRAGGPRTIPGMLGLFIDTCVWLDIAGRLDGQKLIVPLRVLKHQGKLELFVPAVIIDEFERNRPQVEERISAKVHTRFKELRADIRQYGGEDRQDWVEEMTHLIPLVSAGALQNFTEIADLLKSGRRIEPTEAHYAQVVQRGLEKKVPFHLDKNSVADALLIEMYTSLLQAADQAFDQYCFATRNFKDFSAPNGDKRQPRPDQGELFAADTSRYAYDVDGLREVLTDYFGEVFLDEVKEVRMAHLEPRTLTDILEAEHEYFDKIWYVRKLILKEKIEAGEREPMSPDASALFEASLRTIEERYGAENVGPWDDWGWGFVHGKLSALRWVLGSDWDFLDT
jgi:PIN domain